MSAPDDRPRGADRIARRLAAAGCRFAFGVPGGEVLDLLDALERAGLAFVLVRHENAGGFMAEGTHHVSGAPGVLLATLGPGVANLTNVVANARQERVPLVVLSGCVDPADRVTYTHQVFDHRALLAPIVKGTFEVTGGAVEAAVDAALALALDGRPGPVHLDVPVSVARARTDEPPRAPRPRIAKSAPTERAPILAALEAAARPLVIAGLDALEHAAALRHFAEGWDLPVLTTYKAKGVIDERSPRAIGAFGLSPKADAMILPFVREADVVVLAGYDPIEVRMPWREPFAPDATVIALSPEPEVHGVHRMDHLIVGDVGAALGALSYQGPRRDLSRASAVRDALEAAFAPQETWGPGVIADVIDREVSSDARLSVDTGAHRILLSQRLRCAWPRRLLQSTGLGTMGCALPLAIGAKLAEPKREVLAITGDAGLEMVLGELATLRDLGLPITVLVIDDRSLALIELKQRARGFPNLGVDFGGTDFVAVAEALGGDGVLVESRPALEAALRAPLGKRFRLLHCVVSRRAYDDRI